MSLVETELAQENQVQAAARLDEVARLIAHHTQGSLMAALDERLKKYRRRLTRLEARQTAAMLVS